MKYTADLDGWPVIIQDETGKIVATFHCLETMGYPYMPAEQVFKHVEAVLALLNTAPSEKLAYFLAGPILAATFTAQALGAL